MTHLFAATVGPVQEFIAAARRTRDLWFGSHMLSEISRAVAVVVEKHGKLIFPESTAATNVANVILAELRDGEDPAAVAAAAKKTAQEKWLEFAIPVGNDYKQIIRRDIWDDQVNDVVEFYAAWVPASGKYQEDRARVMRLLAGRKNCRDFLAANGRAGVPKSSLDGARESVLKEPGVWRRHDRRCLRVRDGEQLDVAGLVKRVSGGTQPYPSVARVAAESWLRGCTGRLGGLISACEELNRREGSDVIRRVDLIAHRHYENFPFEGTTVFRSRQYELREEADLTPEALRALNEVLAALIRDGGEPNPYLAVIVADGDKIGETISKLTSADENRKFSATLAEFAAKARVIVEGGKLDDRTIEGHHGVLVYAGGDDVFAFVPVDQCLGCAHKLHNTFGEMMGNLVRELNTDRGEQLEAKMTLSVGVAIGHFMENLEDLRQYGHDAEKHAKRLDRDGLAVHLHKRGGSPIKVRARWSENPDQQLAEYARLLLVRAIPNRLPYDLRQMADVYEQWPPATVAAAICRDVLRMISAKEGDTTQLGAVASAVRQRVHDARSLRDFADELLLARQIATARRQSGEETK